MTAASDPELLLLLVPNTSRLCLLAAWSEQKLPAQLSACTQGWVGPGAATQRPRQTPQEPRPPSHCCFSQACWGLRSSGLPANAAPCPPGRSESHGGDVLPTEGAAEAVVMGPPA